ncbi:MAG: hypothetical protein KGY67_00300 [Candidatus Thermoplasmatota archaeon]|nr:hypothetical protein [Candidatus Thermoplasmatota archaeon]
MKYRIEILENDSSKKIVYGKSIKYTTASKIFNEKTGLHTTPHHFKSNDTFSITDTNTNIRLISFYGKDVDFILYENGNYIEENVKATFKVIR